MTVRMGDKFHGIVHGYCNMSQRSYYVYILTNIGHTVFYTGVTNDLMRRVTEHRSKSITGFTQKYNVSKLVYFEQTGEVLSAIEREKQIKDYRREKKKNLIEGLNPRWKDLYDEILY